VSLRLLLMRHGQSERNARNLFTGRADPDPGGR
jgi:bisphosphoglycerate-dependent phosphoglycerate mutase